MRTWNQFRQVRPDLTEAGRSLFYQHGVGLRSSLPSGLTEARESIRCVP